MDNKQETKNRKNLELRALREQIDRLDKSLDYLLLLRSSLAVLVGKVKMEQGLPILHTDREKQIYASQELFAKETGISKDLLTHLFEKLIAEAVRIETDPQLQAMENTTPKDLEDALLLSNQALDVFTAHMDALKDAFAAEGIEGPDFLKSLTQSYEEYLVK